MRSTVGRVGRRWESKWDGGERETGEEAGVRRELGWNKQEPGGMGFGGRHPGPWRGFRQQKVKLGMGGQG